ncbi:unnamed protein product [Didymodactylos carnosus]|uniref:Asteroid domain-containing protein n=1 Tax=Didymodactylos carnosus TaxID=1234261 RepID=A0A813S872_9BILA|nr:unnamed protein product [Didymodactylos carnosus]CAF3576839.1 unnamed protein product [Didymodactylos carnosus]
MGIPYFNKFIFKHYSTSLFTPITLKTTDNVIIDGNSLCYDILSKVRKCSPFAYNKYYKQIFKYLKTFKDKCQNVGVVFDGVYRKEFNTNQAYSDNDTQQMPLLLQHTMINVLEKLEIRYRSAAKEADPLCVHLANKLNAYVIGFDSDYYCYHIGKGYIPLKYLDFTTLSGQLYCYKTLLNVYKGLTMRCLALLPVIMCSVGYDIDNQQALGLYLKDNVHIEKKTKKKYNEWLTGINDGDLKEIEILTNIWYLLHWLKTIPNQSDCDSTTIINKFIINNPSLFNLFWHKQTIDNTIKQNKIVNLANMFLNPSDIKNYGTKYENQIPSYIMKLFLHGRLDSSVIQLLMYRHFTCQYNQNKEHQHILLPLFSMLLNYLHQRPRIDCVQFIYTDVINNVKMNYEMENCGEDLFEKRKKKSSEKLLYVYRCLISPDDNREDIKNKLLNNNFIHDDHRLWLLLMRYWYKTKTETKISNHIYLFGFILSYLTLNFLDTFDNDDVKEDLMIKEPLLQYSINSFRKLSESKWRQIQCKIPDIDWIKNEEFNNQIYYVEQIYKNILLVRQVHLHCKSKEFKLVPANFLSNIIFAFHADTNKNVKQIWKEMANILNNNPYLMQLTKEMYQFITV